MVCAEHFHTHVVQIMLDTEVNLESYWDSLFLSQGMENVICSNQLELIRVQAFICLKLFLEEVIRI